MFRIKLYQYRYKYLVLWYNVKYMWKTKHIHFYRTKFTEGVNAYMECRCGSRKVVYTNIGYTPIDVEWLSGISTPSVEELLGRCDE